MKINLAAKESIDISMIFKDKPHLEPNEMAVIGAFNKAIKSSQPVPFNVFVNKESFAVSVTIPDLDDNIEIDISQAANEISRWTGTTSSNIVIGTRSSKRQ